MGDSNRPTNNLKNKDGGNTSAGQPTQVFEEEELQVEVEVDEQAEEHVDNAPTNPPVLPLKIVNSSNLGPGTASANQGTRNQRYRGSQNTVANSSNLTGNSGSACNNSANGVAAYVQENINQGNGNNCKARNQTPQRRRHNYDHEQDIVIDDTEPELEPGAFGGDIGLYQPIEGESNNGNVIGVEGFDMRLLQPGSVPYNWQATKKTLRERLSYIFNSESMSDVHFLVGKGSQPQRIPAHKFVLSIGSAVFDAMFNGGMATTSNEVELPDVEPSAFLALLRFLYTDEVSIGPETVMTSLYTAKKYAVPALEKACVDFLKRNLSSDNAFMLLTQARLFDEPQLAALCLETIDKNTKEAISAEGFTDIDLDTLCVVLERDTLGIRECKLFNAVCRWAESECLRQSLSVISENQRRVLGRALELIRFPLMTVEEFAMGAAQSGILLDREVVQLFLHFTVNPKPPVTFLDTPRCCLTGKEQVVSRFCQIESRWGYSGTSDRIRLVVNRRIFIVGFGLYGSIHGPSEYNVNIQVIHTDSGKTCGQNDATFQCDGSTSTFRVMFKEPVELLPNTSYTACATLKGPDSYYGTKGLRKVTHESMTSGKVTFQFTYAAGNNNGTSVEDGQLPEIIFYT